MIDGSVSLPTNTLREEIESMYLKTKFYIPPPEDLIAKSIFSEEPIRSGAPFGFVKTDLLRGLEKKDEKMNAPRDRNATGGA